MTFSEMHAPDTGPAEDARARRDDAPLPLIVTSRDGLSPEDGIARWRQQLSGYADTEPLAPDPREFRIHTRAWHFGDLVAVDAQLGARRQARTARKVRSGQLDHYRLILQTEGLLRLDADGERIVVGPGQIVLSDMARPEVYEADAGRNLVLYLPRDVLDEALPRPLDLHCLVPRGAGAAMFADYLGNLVRHASDLRSAQAATLSASTVQMLAAALAPTAHAAARAAPTIDSTMLRQACRYIELHLTDAELDATSLGAFLQVSRATLYRLFEPLGGVASHIRERRMVRIHALLAERRGPVHLGRIADDFGFRSASHFSQAFRRQFGCSPSEARELARPHAGSPPAPQAQGEQGPSLSDWVLTLRG